MKVQVVLAALLTISLAGCFGAVEPPADATIDSDETLPGLSLSSWTEMRGNRLRMMALVTNDGPDTYDIRIGCGEPWRSTIIAPDGGEIDFHEVLEEPACPTYWDVLRPRQDVEALYSWNFRDHDARNSTSTAVPEGLYTWHLQFTLRDRDEVLETSIPIRVGPADPIDDFTMALATGRIAATHGINVTVHNGGDGDPEFWTGCMMEWQVRILDATGDEVPTEPGATCAGFRNTTFPAGDTVYAEFFWDGMVWNGQANEPAPQGTYEWAITFGLTGASADHGTLTQRAAFTV